MGTVTKVVIDSNVFISAFGWDGKPEAVLHLLEQGRLSGMNVGGRGSNAWLVLKMYLGFSLEASLTVRASAR